MKTFNSWLKEMYHPPAVAQHATQHQIVQPAESDLLNQNTIGNFLSKLSEASKQASILQQYIESAEQRNLVFNKAKLEEIKNILRNIRHKIKAVQMYEKQMMSALRIGDDGDKQLISSNNMDIQKILDASKVLNEINDEMLEILRNSKYSETDDLLSNNLIKVKDLDNILDNFQLRLGLEHPEDSEELLKNLQSRMKTLFR